MNRMDIEPNPKLYMALRVCPQTDFISKYARDTHHRDKCNEQINWHWEYCIVFRMAFNVADERKFHS